MAAAAVRVGAENSDLPPRPAPLDGGCAVMGSLKMYCFSPSVDVLDAHLMPCQTVSLLAAHNRLSSLALFARAGRARTVQARVREEGGRKGRR